MGGGTHVRYTAPAAVGVKSFTYTISDGKGGTASATVTVTVNAPANNPPSANNDSASLTVGESTSIMVLANDSDPDGDAIFVSDVSTPTGGSASVAPGGGYLIYNAPTTAGTYSFYYWISDGRGGTSAAIVYVTVNPPPNRPPIANNDSATTGTSNSSFIFVLNNDFDPDGDPLTITSVSAVNGGGVATNMSGSSIRFDAPGDPGVKTFTYTISDGRGGTASATVTVDVSSSNRLPVAVNDVRTVKKATTTSISVLANDSDPDDDPLTIISVTVPSAGEVSIAPGGKHVVYVAPNWTDVNTFYYTISDGKGGTATALVRVTVTNPGGPLD
ncbi:tandem-95 repeat protein [Brevundimonas naejangsanensis]|uniref:Tandem-95 repeat protein n=1 Tax=Brevundimonas naejangsanensis TaxID=588932 RepID=A0A494RHI3_9CAUL|nr:Ig-like domain-containing protein [Brevundimonas naejangsanensis]AYG93960.1 tandem-95 repeat protein [Brevundimonas naejangsanensis]